jgi:hypothetical protein
MIQFVVPAAGAFGIQDYLSLDESSIGERFHVVHYEDLATTNSFDHGPYVFAGLEKLSGPMERRVAELIDALGAAGGVRILNDPRRSLGRLPLLDRLHHLGRNPFRAERATGDLHGLRYPVFLREERSHGGSLTPLLHSVREAKTAIGRALVQGHALRDLVVIEFCDARSADGLYRKYAAFRMGDWIHARGLNQGRDWMTKFETSDFTVPLALEEQDYVLRNPHAEQLAELFDIAGIEYGQMDYALKDGRVVTWEINMNPTIGRGAGPGGGVGPMEVRPIRTAAREYFFDRFREAWAALDTVASAGRPVAVNFTPDAALAAPVASAAAAPALRAMRILRAMLRPLKPVLAPVSAPFFRLWTSVVRAAQRQRPPD